MSLVWITLSLDKTEILPACATAQNFSTVFSLVLNGPRRATSSFWELPLVVRHPTKEMVVDFVTKHVDAATMLTCVSGLGFSFQSGESKLTLKA